MTTEIVTTYPHAGIGTLLQHSDLANERHHALGEGAGDLHLSGFFLLQCVGNNRQAGNSLLNSC